MATPVVSRRAVAALLLARQHLARPRTRQLTTSSLLAFVEDVGGLQIDSINVVERGHHLTLWSRFGPYDRRTLDRLVYRRRLLFEYWAHTACLVPASHFAAWRRAMLDYSLRSRAWGGWLRRNRRLLRAVEDAIASGGPLGRAVRNERTAGLSNDRAASVHQSLSSPTGRGRRTQGASSGPCRGQAPLGNAPAARSSAA